MKKWILAFIVCLLVASPVVALADTTPAVDNSIFRLIPDFPTLTGDVFYDLRTGQLGFGTTTSLMSWEAFIIKVGYISQIKGSESPTNIAIATLTVDLNTLLGKNNIKYCWSDILDISLGLWGGLNLNNSPVSIEYGVNATIIKIKI